MGLLTSLLDNRSALQKAMEDPNYPITEPTNLGNGILYFDCIHIHFILSLTHYLKSHPDTHIISISGSFNDGSYNNASIWGYIVIVDKKL